MVSVLRGLLISVWALLVPLLILMCEFRLTTRWRIPINVDVLISLLVIVATLLGGAALFCIRTSLARRIVAFVGYMLVASAALLLVYPVFACAFSNCP